MRDTLDVAHDAIVWQLVRLATHSPVGIAVIVVVLVLAVAARGGARPRFGRRFESRPRRRRDPSAGVPATRVAGRRRRGWR